MHWEMLILMDDDQLIARALRAYRQRPFLRMKEDGVGGHWDSLTLIVPVGDPDHGKLVEHKGRRFVIVADEDGGVLALYLVRSGRLRRLSRWPSLG